MENNILNIPSMSLFNNKWELLLMFMDNEGNPPFHIDGDLDLEDCDIETLGSLVSVGGNLNLKYSSIKSLGDLEYVGGTLNLYDTPIESLGNLKVVVDNLHLGNTNISSLGNLQSVDGDLYIGFMPNLKMTKEEIRKQVNVCGDIYK